MARRPPLRVRCRPQGGRRLREHREVPRLRVLVASGERRDGHPRRLRDGEGHAHRAEDAGDALVPGRAGVEQLGPGPGRPSRARPPEVVLTAQGSRSMRRRSQLYVPANNPRMIAKAATLDADSIVFDLEDAVPLEEKVTARVSLGSALGKADWGSRHLAVRINAPGTPDGQADIVTLAAEPRITTLVIPKAEADLSALARATGKDLIPLIETPTGLLHIEEVVRSERAIAVSYGPSDLAASIGGEIRTWERNPYVRTLIAVAAAAYGLDAIDNVFFDLKDLDGFREEAIDAK